MIDGFASLALRSGVALMKLVKARDFGLEDCVRSLGLYVLDQFYRLLQCLLLLFEVFILVRDSFILHLRLEI